VDFIGAIGIALVIWFGGYQILTGVSASGTALTIGIVIAFVQYSQQLFQPIRDLSDKFNVLQAAIVASHRIFVLLDLPIDDRNARKPKKPEKPSAKSNFKTSGSLIKKQLGFERRFFYDQSGRINRARRSYRFGKNDRDESFNALLRRAERKNSARRR
jgi:ABC-type multidrug transport system fused ATPase/permease subunit